MTLVVTASRGNPIVTGAHTRLAVTAAKASIVAPTTENNGLWTVVSCGLFTYYKAVT